jgi:hypothetical protein
MTGRCYYCPRDGDELQPNQEGKTIFLCKSHMIIMNNPQLAPRFLRGVLSAQMRGKMPEEELNKMIGAFIKLIGTWKPKYH